MNCFSLKKIIIIKFIVIVKETQRSKNLLETSRRYGNSTFSVQSYEEKAKISE